MKAVRFEQTGGPEVLQYIDVDTPTPGAGEVRVRVVAQVLRAQVVGRLVAGPLSTADADHVVRCVLVPLLRG